MKWFDNIMTEGSMRFRSFRYTVSMVAVMLLFLTSMTVAAATPSYNVTVERKDGMLYKTLEIVEELEGENPEVLESRIYKGEDYTLQSSEILGVTTGYRDGKEITIFKEFEQEDKNAKIKSLPEEVVEEGITFRLNPENVTVERGDYEIEYTVEDYHTTQSVPDNDIARISKEMRISGTVYNLTGVTYNVTAVDSSGVPTMYNAACTYSTLITEEIPISYIVKAEYVGHEQEEYVTSSSVRMVYTCVTEDVTGAVVATTGGAACIGVFLFLMSTSIPIYNLTLTGEYKYLGRARLKKNNRTYQIFINKELINKAWSSEYMVRFTKRQVDYVGKNLVEITTSDGKTIKMLVKEVIHFFV